MGIRQPTVLPTKCSSLCSLCWLLPFFLPRLKELEFLELLGPAGRSLETTSCCERGRVWRAGQLLRDVQGRVAAQREALPRAPDVRVLRWQLLLLQEENWAAADDYG